MQEKRGGGGGGRITFFNVWSGHFGRTATTPIQVKEVGLLLKPTGQWSVETHNTHFHIITRHLLTNSSPSSPWRW